MVFSVRILEFKDDFVKLFRFLFNSALFWPLLLCIGKNFRFLHRGAIRFTSNLRSNSGFDFRQLFDDKIENCARDPIPIAIVLILGGNSAFVDSRFQNLQLLKKKTLP
jgi:hypothetical protein